MMTRSVLVVDDELNIRSLLTMLLQDSGFTVHAVGSAEQGLDHLKDPNIDVVLTDLHLPGLSGEEFIGRCRQERPEVPVIVITAHGSIESAVECIRQGASNYLTKPFQPEELEVAVHNALRLNDLLRENERLRASVARQGPALLGHSAAAQRLQEEIQRVAPYKTNVLITGESGTGKELVARSVHQSGGRAGGPWVALNCAAIPRDLMESELFGYVRGAFTGAAQKRSGRLEQAQGGTLFLDEIGELGMEMQAKLLRVLQEKEYSPLGSEQVRALDVRFIAATNRDLKAMVRAGSFREDLLYRLDVYSIHVPALRERPDDIPLLAASFVAEFAREMDKPVERLAAAAEAALQAYPWPGNVRELRNAMERAVLTTRGTIIDLADLPQAVTRPEPGGAAPVPLRAADLPLDAWLEEMEREAILAALRQCGGIQVEAARRLGISERSLWHRIKKLAIQINRQPA